MQNEVKTNIIRIIQDKVNSERDNVIRKIDIEEMTEFSNIGINSMIFVKIVVELELQFGFVFDDEKLVIDEFKCVGSLGEYVESKMKQNN